MANIQHKDIVDPNIHEPKGITTASQGQAYLADGLGGGAWKDVVTPETGTVTSSHIAWTFAKDSSHYTSNQNRVERLSAGFTQSESRGDSFTLTSNYILIKEKGFYLFDYELYYWVIAHIASDGWMTTEGTFGWSESDSGFNNVNALWGITPKISTYKNKQGETVRSNTYVRSMSCYFPANTRLALWSKPFYISKSGGDGNYGAYKVSGKAQLTKIPEIV